MRLLVDTHYWLWYLLAPEKLSADTQALFRSDENEVFLLVASAWEIGIKHALGKLRWPLAPGDYIPDRTVALGHRTAPIELRHVVHIAQLPLHHRDPFDRVLVAQAQVDGLKLVTADRQLTAYAVDQVWAGQGQGEVDPQGRGSADSLSSARTPNAR